MYRESRTVSCGCEVLFDVVADVRSYPQFLPGWDRVRVHEQSDGSLQVEQQVKFGPLNERLRSTARLERPTRIVVEPDPAQKTAGVALEWHFEAVGDEACRVGLQVEGRARNGLVRRLLNGFIHKASQDMIERFTRRVQALYDIPCRILK